MPIFPIVNLNGTSRQELIDQHVKALDALRDALQALRETHPNGRDFQTAPPGTHKIALAQHRDRCIKIEAVLNELQQVAEGIR